ncbi:sulfhydryl oxidase 2-like isoform X2 [Chiloscyllium punctatum]|uniref:sulfhydryl oxidase 2-like isoform X2 n=1 Tax=Chiloscyllium punctatum TaxID=137246 RepID=UPI003B635571
MAPCGPGQTPVTGHRRFPGAAAVSRPHRPAVQQVGAVTILEADGVKGLFGNPSAAWVVEFYWSWGGPCVNSGATWKVLGPGGERYLK